MKIYIKLLKQHEIKEKETFSYDLLSKERYRGIYFESFDFDFDSF
jgi:hypothetical protein